MACWSPTLSSCPGDTGLTWGLGGCLMEVAGRTRTNQTKGHPMSALEDLTTTDVAANVADAANSIYTFSEEKFYTDQNLTITAPHTSTSPSGAASLTFAVTDNETGETRTFCINVTAMEVRNVGS